MKRNNTVAEFLSLAEGIEHSLYLPALICKILKWSANKLPKVAIAGIKNLNLSLDST